MAAELPASFSKFSYLLRPSKQVERKLIIEALQLLRNGGFPVREYTYVGLGSVYYADFILFHKYLYIDRMICAEAREIPRRMRFNKPYKFIRLQMGPIGDLLPRLNRKRRYFVWLDYDSGLDEDISQDVRTAINVLADGSVFLVTVDVEPDHQGENQNRTRSALAELVERFTGSFGNYVDQPIRRSDFSERRLPSMVSEILRKLCHQEAGRRPGLRFFPLFNFVYADGAQMLSFGGVVGSDRTGGQLQKSGIYSLPFITGGSAPMGISVPPLTPREKHWLDQNLAEGITVEDLRFELGQGELDSFQRYCRHYPSYYEALL